MVQKPFLLVPEVVKTGFHELLIWIYLSHLNNVFLLSSGQHLFSLASTEKEKSFF